MAIGDSYATNGKYKAIIGVSSGDHDTEIDAQLLACSRYLERKLGRFFNKDSTALTRTYLTRECVIADMSDYYYPERTRLLIPDDMAAAPTLIRIDETRVGTFARTLLTSEYELGPRNALRGPEPQPYRTIDLLRYGTYPAWLYDSVVEITAVWGWPAVPEAISQAVCQLVGILRLDSPRATNQLSQGLDTLIGTSRQAQDIVEELQRVYGKRFVYA